MCTIITMMLNIESPVHTGLFFGKTYRHNENISHFKSSADSPGEFPVSNFSQIQQLLLLANFC